MKKMLDDALLKIAALFNSNGPAKDLIEKLAGKNAEEWQNALKPLSRLTAAEVEKRLAMRISEVETFSLEVGGRTLEDLLQVGSERVFCQDVSDTLKNESFSLGETKSRSVSFAAGSLFDLFGIKGQIPWRLLLNRGFLAAYGYTPCLPGDALHFFKVCKESVDALVIGSEPWITSRFDLNSREVAEHNFFLIQGARSLWWAPNAKLLMNQLSLASDSYSSFWNWMFRRIK